MAFIAPVAAEVGGWTLRKILPWALVAMAVLVLGGALWVQTARLGAAHDTVKTLTDRSNTLSQDVKRWQASAGSMQRVIDDQAAQLTQHQADAAKAQAVADSRTESQAREITDLNNQLDAMKEKARAHPDQVRPLGPLVLDVLGGLHGDAGAAATAPASH